MARGKSINMYLMDGDVNGRIKCTLANWTGLAFKSQELLSIYVRTEMN